jgi:hypothetical protein
MGDFSVRMFFDTKAVMDMVAKKEIKALTKAGAYVRTSAKSSLRYTKGSSSPGSPPHVHRGSFKRPNGGINPKTGKPFKNPTASLLKEWIFFQYDPQTKSVVVGPELTAGGTGAPRNLEKGGTITLTEIVKSGSSKAISRAQADAYRAKLAQGLLFVPADQKVQRSFQTRARPFMFPALKTNAPKFPGLFGE